MKHPGEKTLGFARHVSKRAYRNQRGGHASRVTFERSDPIMHSSGGGNRMTDDDRVAEFARDQLARYSEYQAHKESMAYVGFALFAGVVGTILVSGDWPPSAWGIYNETLALIGLSVAWFALLFYLRFQLRRRRWAALRIAACEHVLARWATNDLGRPEDPQAANQNSKSKVNWVRWIVDFLVPWPGAVAAIEKAKPGAQGIYPAAFVTELEQAESNRTDAIYHEWLIHATGWLLYLAAMVRTRPDLVNIPSSLFHFAKRLV